MVKLISHRGLRGGVYGENTYQAINNALKSNKYMGVEFDVRLTKDNEVVLLHDSFINRTSNGEGQIENLTLEEVRRYNFGDSIWQNIPKLTDILSINTDKILLIEIKVNDNAHLFSKIIVPLIKGYDNIYIISFNKRVLNYIRRMDKNIKVGLICVFKRQLLFNGDIYIIRYNMLKSKLINHKKKVFIWGNNKTFSDKYYSIIDE